MDRRSFSFFAAFGLGLPLIARSSRALELGAAKTPAAKPAVGPPSSAPSAGELLARIEAFYEKVMTFEARFQERSNVLPYGKERGFAGSVIFEQPHKMSWRFGSGNRVVSDGIRLRVYERDNRRMYDQEPTASLYPVALSFLIAQGELGRSFRFTAGPKQINTESLHVLLAEPLQPSAWRLLALYIDVRSHAVRRVKITDTHGNRHGFDFAAARVNTPVPRGEFAFSPPPQTQIIHV